MSSNLTKAVYGKADKSENNLMIKLECEMTVAGCAWAGGKELRSPLKSASHSVGLGTTPGHLFFFQRWVAH